MCCSTIISLVHIQLPGWHQKPYTVLASNRGGQSCCCLASTCFGEEPKDRESAKHLWSHHKGSISSTCEVKPNSGMVNLTSVISIPRVRSEPLGLDICLPASASTVVANPTRSRRWSSSLRETLLDEGTVDRPRDSGCEIRRLKSLVSSAVRKAKKRVAERFRNGHPACQIVSIALVRFRSDKLVFLAFYRRQLPSRPTPFLAYEFAIETEEISELSEEDGAIYRPRGYK